MARSCPIDKLAEAVNDILEDYKEDIKRDVDIITQRMGAEGAKALRRQSRRVLKRRTGEYAKGWKYEYRVTRRYAKTTVFNEHYSLPHLLEHGHVTRNGTGRIYPPTPAHEHIAPVERQLVDAYEREVINKI